MIDFHCHIDLFPEPEKIIQTCEAEGIYVLAVTTTPKSWAHLQTLLAGHKRIKAAIGLHPELVAERASEVEELCAIMADTKYVGEVGLDGSPALRSTFNLQQKIFARVLIRAAELGGRILSIHSRRAASPVLEAIGREKKAGTPVLHWFSGTKKELESAVALGCWFSVGPAMLEGEKGRDLVASMPRDRVLTETDGPFARLGSTSLTPKDVNTAQEALASLWGISLHEVKATLLRNFRALVAPSA